MLKTDFFFPSTGVLFSLSGWTGGQMQMPGFDSNPRPSDAPSPCSTVSSSLKLRNRSEKSSEYKRILLLRCILIAKATKQRVSQMFNILLLLQMLHLTCTLSTCDWQESPFGLQTSVQTTPMAVLSSSVHAAMHCLPPLQGLRGLNCNYMLPLSPQLCRKGRGKDGRGRETFDPKLVFEWLKQI